MISTEVARKSWFNEIGNVGGIQGFYGMIIFFLLDHFTGIDYFTTIIKKLFLEQEHDEKFFLKYLNDEEKTKEKSCCRAFCDDMIRYDDEKLDEASCERYKKKKYEEKDKVIESLIDGDVDESDIKTMVFDIFSSRKKFVYDFRERLVLYFGFLGPLYRFCKCRCFNYDRMIRKNTIFERAQDRLNKDADLIEIMDQVRKSKNFQRNFLTRQQKILLKFDQNNIIDAGSNEESGSESEDTREQDDIITESLQSENGLVVMFSLGKLMKILKPYTEEQKLGYFDKNLFQSFYSKKADAEEDPVDVKLPAPTTPD